MAMRVIDEATLRKHVTTKMALEAVTMAFGKLAEGKVSQPPVMQLMFPERGGETCVKAAHLKGREVYAVKVASGFSANASEGLSTGNGLMLLLSAISGAPLALLQDNGWLTDLRTAAAGALATQVLTRADKPLRVAIIGSGIQARMQLDAISRIRDIASVSIWTRTPLNGAKYVDESKGYDFQVTQCETPAAAVQHADLIVTTTPSKTGLFGVEHIQAHATIIAVGSDTPGKQEVDVSVLKRIAGGGGRVVGDKRSQVVRLGECQQAAVAGLEEAAIAELGDVVLGKAAKRGPEDGIILCDLTGVGVQDAAIAEVAYNAVKGASE